MKKVFLAAKVHIQDPIQAVRSTRTPCCSCVGFLVVDSGEGGRGTEEPSLFFRKRRVCNNPPQSLRPDLISVFGFVFYAVFRSPVCCLKLSLHTSWTECFALCCSVLVSALSLNKTHSFRMKSCYFRMLSQFMKKNNI